mgnify:FL=1
MTRRMGTVYEGEEDSARFRRLTKRDPHLTVANAHLHPCSLCKRKYYCWCGRPIRDEGPCSDCSHELSLPKVVRLGKGWDGYRTSRLFSDIQVSQGGWSSQWVTTSELRSSLSRWIAGEYKASPPEVTEEAGAYQCGGCRFFLALDGDYGICANAASRYDGRIVFEHIGCEANPHYIKNHEGIQP